MKEITIPALQNPVDFFGVNDANLELLRKKFPSLKIISRGSDLKLIGEDDLVEKAESVVMEMVQVYETRGRVDHTFVADLLQGKSEKNAPSTSSGESNIIVYGQHG
ncbi:MAG: hypothetical protein ACKPAD_08080, partial [Bacteroidota bacterium]